MCCLLQVTLISYIMVGHSNSWLLKDFTFENAKIDQAKMGLLSAFIYVYNGKRENDQLSTNTFKCIAWSAPGFALFKVRLFALWYL